MPAVAYDSVGAGVVQVNNTSTSEVHTLGGTANAILVGVAVWDGSNGHTSYTRTMKIGTTVIPSLGAQDNQNSGQYGWVELFGLQGTIPTGTQTISFTCTGPNTPDIGGMNSVAYRNVASFGTAVLNNGSGNSLSTGAITAASGDMVIGALDCGTNRSVSSPNGTQRFNSGSGASGYNGILIEDAAGAASVTLTCTGSNTSWGAVGVCLRQITTVAWTADATLAVTASTTAVQGVVASASLALTTTLNVGFVAVTPFTPLNYPGMLDNTAGQLATWDWAQAEAASVAVTPTYVNNVIATYTPALATPAYVDSQVALRATQGAVTTDQSHYAPFSLLGAASGIATITSGFVTSNQVPSGIQTENKAQCYNVSNPTYGTISLTSTHTVTTSSPTEYTAAQINIPNPGYAYVPMPFVYIMGQAGGSQAGRQFGTGDYGLITVMSPSGSGNSNLYALGICTASPHLNWYCATPTADVLTGGQITVQTSPPVTPLVTKPVTGPLTLNVNLCCFGGNSFTFSGTGLQFFVIVFPAI
jgi:hypothetical protein